MKIWIVGKNGLVARTLIESSFQKSLQVIATSHAQVDITNPAQIAQFVEKERPTHIINTAAYTRVDDAEKDQEAAYLLNAIAPENLVKIAKEHSVHFLHLSTDYVFDGQKNTPYSEQDATHPINIYGKSKLEGEERVRALYPQACILRTSWLFREGGSTFFSTLLQRLKEQPTIQVVSDQTGSPTYCFDLADAIWQLLSHSGIVHFANKGACSRFEFALFVKEAAARLGIPILCKEITPSTSHFPAPRPTFSALDTHHYTTVTGKAPRTWQEVTEEYLKNAT